MLKPGEQKVVCEKLVNVVTVMDCASAVICIWGSMQKFAQYPVRLTSAATLQDTNHADEPWSSI